LIEYNPSNWNLTKRLLGQIRPYLGIFLVINVTSIWSVLNLVMPLLVLLVIDYVLIPVPGDTNWFMEIVKTSTGVTDRYGLLLILISMMILLHLVRGVLTVIHRYTRGILSQNILRDLRKELYEALISKSFSYLGQVRTGQIISRVTSDMNSIDLFYSETVRESFRMTLQLVIAVAILLSINTGLTVITLLPLPFIFLATWLYTSKVRVLMLAVKSQFDTLNEVLVEGITAQKLIKGFGQEESFATRFEKENQGYVEKNLKTLKLQAAYTSNGTVITALGIALALTFGGIMASKGELTLGELLLFGSYFAQMAGPVRMYARIIDWYQDGIVSARRVYEVIDVGKDVPEPEHPVELPRLKGEVEFKDVSFSYSETSEVLRDVDLKISPGEKVAIIGFVGSGKSALTELVPRFYDATTGAVLVDGFNVKEVSLKSLRGQIGIVLQDIYIFSTTIKENLTFGKPEASDEEIIAAAKTAQIHDYIASLPKGYDTDVGERGLTLSGGQRQRIAIARVILSNPRILILDDSTSNVDAETEAFIRKAIDGLLEGRTALIITQRASTCENADKVVVIDQGRIIAYGKHSSLLKTSERYRMLIESQTLSIDPDD
jgi:ABC-type multidrug transport system fused ATPase/permease subunit